MKRPGFFNGVLAALILAIIAGAAFAGLGAVFATASILQLIVTSLAGAYVAYLLGRSPDRTGRVATLVIWTLAALAGWALAPNLAVLLCLHVLMIWLVRVLHYHSGVLTALADLGLSCLALASAIWAAQQSGSLFMAVWCFFLVQALFVAIPKSFAAEIPSADGETDDFQRAYRAAESAVRRIATQR
ncbi:MAG: hypothetical protein OES38_06480 [Gammaproteobacteria bacterium]|nr:hypothetical protein [Gammaproteobacteria bacterium]